MPAKPKSRGKKHSGTLIVGAPTGDFYFLRDDERPKKIPKDSKLEKRLRQYFKTKPLEKATVADLRNDLPQDILDLIEDFIGPLGFWHILRRA